MNKVEKIEKKPEKIVIEYPKKNDTNTTDINEKQ